MTRTTVSGILYKELTRGLYVQIYQQNNANREVNSDETICRENSSGVFALVRDHGREIIILQFVDS